MRIFALVAVALAVACHQDQTPLITPQPGEPCGNVGVPCYDGNPPVFTHDCCPQDFICGGGFPNIGCGKDACCFAPDGAKPHDDGTVHFTKVVSKVHVTPRS